MSSNEERLRAAFRKMSRKNDESEKEIMRDFERLTPPQQKEMINVIEMRGDFFVDLFKGFKNFFYTLYDVIEQGITSVEQIFTMLMAAVAAPILAPVIIVKNLFFD
jgi:hypothetical protein